MSKFLCWIGLHSWVKPDWSFRYCESCDKKQGLYYLGGGRMGFKDE